MTSPIQIHKSCLNAWREAVIRSRKRPARSTQGHDIVKRTIHQEVKDVQRLWEIFTQDRADLGRYLSDPKRQRLAYLIGFHLANTARMNLLLERASERHPQLIKLLNQRVTIHDIGCGTGGQSQGLQSFARNHKINDADWRWSLIDRQASYLETAAFVCTELSDATQVRTIRSDIGALRLDPPTTAADKKDLNILIVGNVWNELARQERTRAKLKQHFENFAKTEAPTLLLMIEPANQNIARQIMVLRNELCEQEWVPLYPCPASSACPMLERTRDWCFSEGEWKQPPEAALVDKLIGTERRVVSGSMYAFANDALCKQLKTPATPKLRVVVGKPIISDPKQRQSKEIELLLCSGTSLSKMAPNANNKNPRRGEPLNT